ncbi:MAG: carboxypeptidase-like regulatory domain-containing protein [Candidatus Methanogranum gryphiswaldense]|nr:MAG: carboxypeptidase-like regulatory domain-containing protein [Candidatus Methanogranum sp. U3.2.1]
MKNKVVLVAFVLAISIMVLPTFTAEYSDSATEYYIEGYIVTTQPEGNVALEGVEVTILYNNTSYSDTTDETGKFSISVPSITGLQIEFTLEGYTIRSCPNITAQEGSDYYVLDLSNVTPTGNVYQITSDADGLLPAIMYPTSANVTGTISYSDGYVNGATVTLVSTDTSERYEAETNSKGIFLIECPTGEYTLTVNCGGFETSKQTIEVKEGTMSVNITLTIKENQTILGLDLMHFIMVIGVIFGIFISCILFILGHRKKNKITIVDDTHVEDEKGKINP